MVLVSFPSSSSFFVFLPSQLSSPYLSFPLVEYQKYGFGAFCHNLNLKKEDFCHPNQGDESPYRVSFCASIFRRCSESGQRSCKSRSCAAGEIPPPGWRLLCTSDGERTEWSGSRWVEGLEGRSEEHTSELQSRRDLVC